MKPILFNTAMVRAILDGRKTVTRRVIKRQPIDSGDCKHELQTFHEMLPEYYSDDYSAACRKCGYGVCPSGESIYKTPYKPGDILYVRETWGYDKNNWIYKADFTPADLDRIASITRWRPSIHMPKEAARIFLRVTRVSVERLQDISNADAIREGITRMYDHLSDEEYEKWSRNVVPGKKKDEWGWDNYLWHGHFGEYGTGSALSDAWEYQYSGYDEPRGSFSSLWNTTVPLKDWGVYGWDANPWVWVIEFEEPANLSENFQKRRINNG